MGVVAISVVSVLYLVTAYDYYGRREYGMCVVFMGYVGANVGFIVDLLMRSRHG